MNVVIYKSLIIHIFVLFYGSHTLPVEIKGNLTGVNGGNGTEIECSYTKQNSILVTVVSFLAFNRSSITSNEIAIYVPNSLSYLTDNGQYLKGRVTLMNITQSTTKAVITFNKLMCIDDTIYQCRVNYIASSGVKNIISNSKSISVQVPPSRPDRVLIVHTPPDSTLASTKHMVYSTSLPSTGVTLTSKETDTLSAVKIANQNDTTINYSTVPRTNHDTTSSTPSNTAFSSDIRNKVTTYSTEQTSTTRGIIEGDNITVFCRGDVGKPPAKHVFQKYLSGHILSMTFTATETSISKISENCSYYRSSNFTFQVTTEDNNAVIRCAVDSPVAQYVLYLETAPIEVYTGISKTPSSSKGSSSCADVKMENSAGNLGSVLAGVSGAVVFMIVIILVRAKRTKKTSETLLSKNESKSFLGLKSKPFVEFKTGNSDFTAVEEEAFKTQTVNNGHEVEDNREHNKEYLKKPEVEEHKKTESNSSPQLDVYSQVNEATKPKDKQQNTETLKLADKQEEGTYAESQEGINDETGNRSHKEKENDEHFDTANNSSQQNSNGDTELSKQTSQIESYNNQAFEKEEHRQVATASPIIRVSGGSQDDEHTNQNRHSQSKEGYESVMG